MYVHFWPTPYGNGSNRLLPVNSQQPVPAREVARSRSLIQRVGELAAKGYVDAQTVGPGMTRDFMNSTGQGTPLDSPNSTAATFSGAPQVVPLNSSGWTPPLPAMATCGDHIVPGVPWADALYSPVPGMGFSVADWIKQHPVLAALAAAAGGFGLYNLGKKR